MELYFSQASPFVRKVRILLHEADKVDAVTLRPVTMTPLDPDGGHVSVAPLGKIPTLTRPDGPAIFDSRVITRYLDAQFGTGLYPEARLWETLTLEALADGIMDASVLMVYEGRTRPEEKRHEPWLEAQWSKISRALDAIEERWMSHLSGHLDMGQIATACALGHLDFRHAARDWRATHPNLAAWSARISERPALRATHPE